MSIGLSQNLTELDGDKVDRYSDTTYSEVKGLGYDETSKKLGLVISQGGADTVIPFSSGGVEAVIRRVTSTSMGSGIDVSADGTVSTGSTSSILGTLSVIPGNASWQIVFSKSGTYYVNNSSTPIVKNAGETYNAGASSASAGIISIVKIP